MAQRDPGQPQRPTWTPPGEYLAVRLAGELVRIAAGPILEIMDPIAATELPGAPPQVLGLVNYRGSPATVVDLALAMERSGDPAARSRLVVIRWRGQDVALAVDEVVTLMDASGGSSAPPIADLDAILGAIIG